MKKLTTILVLFLVAAFLPLPSHSFAATKVFEREYTYQASEIDSKISCRRNAMTQVERLLLEELGVYLESYTEVKNFQLSKDKIIAITAGIVRTEIVGEKWDGEKYWLKAKITVAPGKVARQVNNIRQDRQKAKESEELRKKLTFLLAENEKLKIEIQTIKGKRRELIKNNYQKNIDSIGAINYIEEGNSYIEQCDFENALTSFSKAIVLDPENDKAYLGKSFTYVQLAKYEDAFKDSDKAIKLNPRNPCGYFVKGNACHIMGQPIKAIEYFNKAIETDPLDPLFYSYRGFLYGTIGNRQRALKDFKKASSISFKSIPLYTFRGLYYCMVEKDYKTAIKDLEKATQLDPNNYLGYWGLGTAFWLSEDFDKAIDSLDKTIDLKPNYWPPYLTRAVIYKDFKKYDQALDDYTKAIDLIPDGMMGLEKAYFDRATIFFQRKMYNDAVKDFTKTIGLEPRNALAYHRRGYSYLKAWTFREST